MKVINVLIEQEILIEDLCPADKVIQLLKKERENYSRVKREKSEL